MPNRLRRKHIFINCPFDDTYKPIFDAIVFAVISLGFNARCALEADDSGIVRLEKITQIIGQCAYGIHDISAVGLGDATNLPRFNMPLELGLYFGCKIFGGGKQHEKGCLILDSEPYRYRTSISDIAGQDIHAHRGEPVRAITEVRNWLAAASKVRTFPGGADIAERYARFLRELSKTCRRFKRRSNELTFSDFCEMVDDWLRPKR